MKTVRTNNFEVFSINAVMINSIYELDWAKRSPDSWKNISGCVFEGVSGRD